MRVADSTSRFIDELRQVPGGMKVNTNTTARILRAAPIALAVALSVGACGALPCTSGSNNSSAPYSNSSATSNTAGSSSATRPLASSGSAGQGGVSSGSAGGATSGSGSQSGLSGGVSSGSASTSGMSPDDVAAYCKDSSALFSPDYGWFADNVKPLAELRKHTPVQLVPDVELLQADSDAIAKKDRVYVQVKDEYDAAYKRVMDFNDQICKPH
jgi:hypothetical protein